MSLICVIQARIGSTRLPGKVLAEIAGRPMLTFMLERLADIPVDEIVVATSADPADDPVADEASAAGVAVVRGEEGDVLGRFAHVLDTHASEAVMRLTADCPLMDPEVVAVAVAHWHAMDVDYLSNTLLRTYPDGLDVEIVSSSSLRAAHIEATDQPEREHVTPFVIRRPGRFRLANFHLAESHAHRRWTVDTFDDLEFVRALVAGLPVTVNWRELLARDRRASNDRFTLEADVRGEGVAALDERGRRRWRVLVDGHLVGTLAVEVADGLGRLHVSGTFDEPILSEATQTLRRLLGSQVARLERASGGHSSGDPDSHRPRADDSIGARDGHHA